MFWVNDNSNTKDALKAWICVLNISTRQLNMDDDKTREAGIDSNIPPKKKCAILSALGFTQYQIGSGGTGGLV